MLNIKEIQEKNARYPEPQEVKDIRKHILDTFSDLQFFEYGHKYVWTKPDGVKENLPSVSAMTHAFVEEKDWDAIKEKYALKHNRTVDSVTREWNEKNLISTNNGTSTHLYGENYMKFMMGGTDFDPVIAPQYERGYLVPYSNKQYAIMEFFNDIFNISPDHMIYPVLAESKMHTGVIPEYNLKQNYAGTADMLFAYKAPDGKWKLLIYDYKTNAELEKPDARTYNNLLTGEFSEMYDEPLSLYTLQLSAYSICLQQLGYEIADRKLIWLKDDKTYEKRSVPDVTERLLKVWK